jgi:hypothetical protein
MRRINTPDNRPISFPPIHGHGVIGDRRTGAKVAADGTPVSSGLSVKRLRARETGIARFEVRPRWEFRWGPEDFRATPNDATLRFAAGNWLCGLRFRS